MKFKKFILLGFLLLTLLIPMVLAEVSFSSAMDSFLSFLSNQKEIVSFIVFFVFLLAAFYLGGVKAAGKVGWDTKSGAFRALIVIIAAAGTIGIHFLQQSLGVWFIYEIGGAMLLLVIALVVLVMVFTVYKSGGESLKGLLPALVALVIVLLYNLIEWLYPNFIDRLSSWGTFIYVIYWIAAAVLVFMIGFYMWNHVIGGIFGLKAKKPLTDEEFSGTKKHHSQKEELKRIKEERKAAGKARTTERNLRKDARRVQPKIKQMKDLMGELRELALVKNYEPIKKGWVPRRGGKLRQLQGLRGTTRAYIGLISKIIAETTSISGVDPNEITRLQFFENELIKSSAELGDSLTKISAEIKLIEENPEDKALWGGLNQFIESTDNILDDIAKFVDGATALEQKVREDIGRS